MLGFRETMVSVAYLCLSIADVNIVTDTFIYGLHAISGYLVGYALKVIHRRLIKLFKKPPKPQ